MAFFVSEVIENFLAQERNAVAGISRTKTGAPENMICRKLRLTGD